MHGNINSAKPPAAAGGYTHFTNSAAHRLPPQTDEPLHAAMPNASNFPSMAEQKNRSNTVNMDTPYGHRSTRNCPSPSSTIRESTLRRVPPFSSRGMMPPADMRQTSSSRSQAGRGWAPGRGANDSRSVYEGSYVPHIRAAKVDTPTVVVEDPNFTKSIEELKSLLTVNAGRNTRHRGPQYTSQIFPNMHLQHGYGSANSSATRYQMDRAVESEYGGYGNQFQEANNSLTMKHIEHVAQQILGPCADKIANLENKFIDLLQENKELRKESEFYRTNSEMKETQPTYSALQALPHGQLGNGNAPSTGFDGFISIRNDTLNSTESAGNSLYGKQTKCSVCSVSRGSALPHFFERLSESSARIESAVRDANESYSPNALEHSVKMLRESSVKESDLFLKSFDPQNQVAVDFGKQKLHSLKTKVESATNMVAEASSGLENFEDKVKELERVIKRKTESMLARKNTLLNERGSVDAYKQQLDAVRKKLDRQSQIKQENAKDFEKRMHKIKEAAERIEENHARVSDTDMSPYPEVTHTIHANGWSEKPAITAVDKEIKDKIPEMQNMNLGHHQNVSFTEPSTHYGNEYESPSAVKVKSPNSFDWEADTHKIDPYNMAAESQPYPFQGNASDGNIDGFHKSRVIPASNSILERSTEPIPTHTGGSDQFEEAATQHTARTFDMLFHSTPFMQTDSAEEVVDTTKKQLPNLWGDDDSPYENLLTGDSAAVYGAGGYGNVPGYASNIPNKEPSHEAQNTSSMTRKPPVANVQSLFFGEDSDVNFAAVMNTPFQNPYGPYSK